MRTDGNGVMPAAGAPFLTSAAELLRRRAAVASGVAAFVLIASTVVLLLSRPVYRAEARLKIGEPPPSAGVSPTGGLLSFLRTGGDPFANDLEVLASRTLAEEVVRDAALSVKLDAPMGWYRDSLLVSLALQDTTAKAAFEATWTAGSVVVRQRSPRKADIGSFEVGTPAVFGGMRVVFAPRRPDGPASVVLRTMPFDEAVRITAQKLKIRRTRRDANVLEISYALDEPHVAGAVVESAVRRFLALRLGLFARESGETVDSLRTVLEGTRRDLAAAEDSLEAAQRTTGLVAPDAQSEALIERYETAFTTLLEARAELEALDAQAHRVGLTEEGIPAWSTLAAHPRFIENPTVGELLGRLTELEGLRTEMLSLRRPESLEARTLDQQITQLSGAFEALVSEYRTSLAERIEELAARVSVLDGVLVRLPSETIELGRRQRAVRILSEILVLTEQRLRQEELRQALTFSNVQVIDAPRLRYRPVWPRKKLGIAVASLLALAAGLSAAVVAERADATLRRAGRVRELTGAPLLAVWTDGLSPAEVDTIREATGGACTLVACVGAEAEAPSLAAGLVGAVRTAGPELVDGFAAAAAVARRGDPALLLVRVGATSETDLARVVALIREAGGTVAGTVAVCSSARAAERVWL